MKVVVTVLAILVGVGVIQLAIWIPITRRWRRSAVAFHERFQAETAASGERTLKGPEQAVYRAGSGPYSAVSGNGEIILTDRRLLFHKRSGGDVEVALDKITATRRSAVFRGTRVAGATHLVLSTSDPAEVGFFVGDLDAWERSLAAVIDARPGR